MIRVVVADDEASMRRYLRDALSAEPDFDVCADAADASEAVDAAVSERPDLCILDIRMPGGGVSAAREISSRLPATKIVMFTGSSDDDDLLGALRAGASGYLLKGMTPEGLPDALRSVLSGAAAVPPILVARLIDEFREREPRRRKLLADEPLAVLTSREWQVLDLMRKGMTTTEIADRLVISPVTVRTHVQNILRKAGAGSRDELLRDLERM